MCEVALGGFQQDALTIVENDGNACNSCLGRSHGNQIHSKLHSIIHVATKVHMILRSFVVLKRMSDTVDLV